jgi:aminoglycoside 3-N-acetyltransferase
MDLFEYKGKILDVETFVGALAPYVNQGDILCAEVDTMRFGKLLSGLSRDKFLAGFLELFQRLVGPCGALVIPTFSYSWGANSSDKTYDIVNTPARVGVFPEFFRRQSSVIRTMDPMFSLAIWGADAEDLALGVSKNSFGKGSFYERMLTHNAKLVSFGLNKYDPTFIHYAEQYFHENIRSLDYRFVKKFEGELVDIEGNRYSDVHYCFSRHLDNRGDWKFYDKGLMADLCDRGALHEVTIGGGVVRICEARTVFEVTLAGLTRDMHYLIRKGGDTVCTDTI